MRLPDSWRNGGGVRDEPSERPRAAKYVEHRMGCVVGNCCPENRTALIPVCQKPTPEITTFARPANCSPSASHQREVQKDDRICRTKPDLDSVIGSEVTIHDPTVPRNELLLHGNPLLARCCDKPRLPEDVVHLDHRQPRNLTQAPRQCRFARRPAPQNDHAFHTPSLSKLQCRATVQDCQPARLCGLRAADSKDFAVFLNRSAPKSCLTLTEN
jgi:hypothetical protein